VNGKKNKITGICFSWIPEFRSFRRVPRTIEVVAAEHKTWASPEEGLGEGRKKKRRTEKRWEEGKREKGNW
jgi:hypothetical protein